MRVPGIKGVGLSGVLGTCSAKGLEGRLRRKRKDIYSAQRFSARHGWDRGGKEKGRDEGGGGERLGSI